MGAGIGYKYESFMIIEENKLSGVENLTESLEEVKGKTFEEQNKILDGELELEEGNDNLTDEQIDDFIEEQSEIMNDSYADDFYGTLSEFSTETAKKIGMTYYADNDSIAEGRGYVKLVGTGSIYGMGDNSTDLLVGVLSNDYNSLVITGLKDYQGEIHWKDIDFSDIVCATIQDEAISNFINNPNYLEDVETLRLVIEELDDAPVDTISIVTKGWEEEYNLLKIEFSEHEDEEFSQEFVSKYCEIVNAKIYENIQKQIENTEKQYNNFTDHLFNKLISNYDDGTFYYPTTAWTSRDYTKENLYGSNEEIKNEYFKEAKGKNFLAEFVDNFDVVKDTNLEKESEQLLKENEFYMANYGTDENIEIFKNHEEAKKESVDGKIFIATLNKERIYQEPNGKWNYEDKSDLILSSPVEVENISDNDSKKSTRRQR